jgi:hypothetical protein
LVCWLKVMNSNTPPIAPLWSSSCLTLQWCHTPDNSLIGQNKAIHLVFRAEWLPRFWKGLPWEAALELFLFGDIKFTFHVDIYFVTWWDALLSKSLFIGNAFLFLSDILSRIKNWNFERIAWLYINQLRQSSVNV